MTVQASSVLWLHNVKTMKKANICIYEYLPRTAKSSIALCTLRTHSGMYVHLTLQTSSCIIHLCNIKASESIFDRKNFLCTPVQRRSQFKELIPTLQNCLSVPQNVTKVYVERILYMQVSFNMLTSLVVMCKRNYTLQTT